MNAARSTSRLALVRALLAAAAALATASGANGCSDGAGPGNLLAAHGACDTAPLGADPACDCCGATATAASCVEGSPCAPDGASASCGARCPGDMTCNRNRSICQHFLSDGQACERWSGGSSCGSGLVCDAAGAASGTVCQACHGAGEACSDAATCCACPGGRATCASGLCGCDSSARDAGSDAPTGG